MKENRHHFPRIFSRAWRHARPARAGFSLVEVTLALGLVAFCLVALLGLLHAGLRQERTSIDQTQATHILDAVKDSFRGEMRPPAGVAAGLPSKSRFGLRIPDVGGAPTAETFLVNDSGTLGTRNDPNAYVVHCEIEAPGESEGAFKPYHARILVAWPAAAEFQGSGRKLRLQKAQGYIDASLEWNRG